MRKFNSNELSRLQTTQESSMQDECTIDRYIVTFDSVGDEIKTYIPSSGLACGVKFLKTEEQNKGEYINLKLDAIIRLPIDTELNPNDRITITKRFGVTQSGIQYEFVGNPLIGSSCLQVQVIKVEF